MQLLGMATTNHFFGLSTLKLEIFQKMLDQYLKKYYFLEQSLQLTAKSRKTSYKDLGLVTSTDALSCIITIR